MAHRVTESVPWEYDVCCGDVSLRLSGRELTFNVHEQRESGARDGVRAILRWQMEQIRDAEPAPDRATWLQCVCGRRVALSHAYKCLFCGIWFCRDCAARHFGFRGDHGGAVGEVPAGRFTAETAEKQGMGNGLGARNSRDGGPRPAQAAGR